MQFDKIFSDVQITKDSGIILCKSVVLNDSMYPYHTIPEIYLDLSSKQTSWKGMRAMLSNTAFFVVHCQPIAMYLFAVPLIMVILSRLARLLAQFCFLVSVFVHIMSSRVLKAVLKMFFSSSMFVVIRSLLRVTINFTIAKIQRIDLDVKISTATRKESCTTTRLAPVVVPAVWPRHLSTPRL